MVPMYQVLPGPDEGARSDADRLEEELRVRLLAERIRLARAQSFGPLKDES